MLAQQIQQWLHVYSEATRRRSWRTLRFATEIEYRISQRFTIAGQIVMTGAFTAALFGVDTRRTLGVELFGLGIGILIIALIGSMRRIPKLTAQRYLPRYATVDAPLRYQVRICNQTTQTTPAIVIQDVLPDPRPKLAAFMRTPAPWEHKVNPLDRMLGYPRWRWLVRRGRWAIQPPTADLPALTVGAETTLELELKPCRRGPLTLQHLDAMYQDTLGLCWRRVTIAPSERLLVLPRRYPIAQQRPPGRRRLQPGGIGLAAAVGDSQEFIGLRDYRPGDSPRHIHWGAWARSGNPVVKEYQDEYFSRQALILDNFLPPERVEDFEAAISVAASFVEPLQTSDTLLDLMFVADQAYVMTSGRGLLSSDVLLEVLACIEPSSGNFTTLSQAVLSHAHLLSACLCVFLDWEVSRQALVKQLLALELPVRVLIVGGWSPTLAPGPMASCPQNLCYLDPKQLAAGLASCA